MKIFLLIHLIVATWFFASIVYVQFTTPQYHRSMPMWKGDFILGFIAAYFLWEILVIFLLYEGFKYLVKRIVESW